MNSVNILRGLTAAIAAIAAVSAFAAPQHVNMSALPYSTEPSTTIPVANSDSQLAAKRTLTRADARKIGGFGSINSKALDGQKAVGDNDIVGWFRPIAPCRLLDTRNLGAPIGGPAFAPNSTRTITPATNCGIPNTNVTALQVVFSTQNYTVNSGGYITFKAPGAPITTVNAVYNLGAQWSSASAVVPTNSAGAFDIYVNGATAEVIVDVTGYYSDLDNISTGTQQFDIFGNTPGTVMEIYNAGTGTVLAVHGDGGGPALNIASGSLSINGAGTVNATSAPAFTFKVTASNICPNPTFAVINHTLLNGAAGAQVMSTPRYITASDAVPPVAATLVSYQTLSAGSCGVPSAGGYWLVYLTNGNLVANQAFNILIIK